MELTHGYNLLLKIVRGFIALFLPLYIWGLIPSSFNDKLISSSTPEWVYVVVVGTGVILFIASMVALYMLQLVTIFPESLATYLYLKIRFSIDVTLSEAKKLNPLFDGSYHDDVGLKWFPLRQMRKIPKSEREQFLFEFASQLLNVSFEPEERKNSFREGDYQRTNFKNFSDFTSSSNSDIEDDLTDEEMETFNINDLSDSEKNEYAKCCKILSIPFDANWEHINNSHKTLIKTLHPDLHEKTHEQVRKFVSKKVKEINEAYSILKKYWGK